MKLRVCFHQRDQSMCAIFSSFFFPFVLAIRKISEGKSDRTFKVMVLT